MKVAVVYICPTEEHGPQHRVKAARFVASRLNHPSDHPHDLYVVSNGGSPSRDTQSIFEPLKPTFLVHDDSGMDIGAYQIAAEQVPCDMMIFLGGSTYLKRRNWVNRCAQAFEKHGDGIYGAMGNTGNLTCSVYPHIRTTGFWMPPRLMNAYPERVRTNDRRYPAEHGPDCLTQWCLNQGYKAKVVTWDHECEICEAPSIPNGFHNGDQSQLIFGDRLTEPPFFPIP